MSTVAQTKWRLVGEEINSCMCAWGCPCQFNALPTYGRCEGVFGLQIREGYFGSLRLDGVRVAQIAWWPGPIPAGNGTRQLLIDEQTTPEQRTALIALVSGIHGGAVFEILAAVCPTVLDPIVAPITFELDRERRQAHLRIGDIVESHIEPIKNPVTGAEHRARIVLPEGFEYTEAEMANATSLRVRSKTPLVFEHANTYAHLNTFAWSNI